MIETLFTQGQLTEVNRDDKYGTPTRLLLIATTVSFCCLVILTLLSVAVLALRRLRRSPDRPLSDVRRRRSRWNVAIGAFVVLRAIYALLFTFTGAIATCHLVVRDSWVRY